MNSTENKANKFAAEQDIRTQESDYLGRLGSSPDLPSTPPVVNHDTHARRFETRPAGGPLAFLHYTIAGDRITFDHTFVPDEFRGRGLAALLAHAALTEARRAGWNLVPACSYVAAYIERHPEFADLIHPIKS